MSKEIWNRNLRELEKEYPEIASYFETYDSQSSDELISGVSPVCDKKVLYVIKDEEIIQLDSLYDSNRLLELWYNDFKDNMLLNSKLLLYGFGNGMYVKYFLDNSDEDHSVIVYEPSASVLFTALNEFDLTDTIANKRFKLLFKPVLDKELREYYYDLLNFMDIRSFKYFSYLNYNIVFEDDFYKYMDSLQTAVSSINSTQAVIGRLGHQYNVNTFANIRYLTESDSLVSLFANLPKDTPAIIVAAGPSLDKNIHDLEKAKGKSLIISVDSAIRPLLRAGITPDLVITIDGKKNPRHFEDDASLDVPIVCSLQAHNALLSKHRAKKFFLNDLNHHIQHFLSENDMILPVTSTGGSVANDAFSLALMIGCKRIILVGQDLAYTGNKTHSASSVRGEWNMDVKSFDNNEWVEGIDGQPILSSSEFTLYRNWFEEQITAIKDIRVIDATEGGAKISGTSIMTLRQAIDEECKVRIDFENALNSVKPFFDDDKKKEFIDYYKNLPEELSENKKLVEEAIKCYDKMLKLIYNDKYHGSDMIKLSKRTGEISEYLETNPAMEYVHNDLQLTTTEFLTDVYNTEKDERTELIAVSNKARDYLIKMKEVMDNVILEAEESVKNL